MSKAKDTDWTKLLAPFANAYDRMVGSICRRLERMDPAALKKLLAACDAPTETNCWHATQMAACVIRPYVKAAIKSKLARQKSPTKHTARR